MPRLTPLDPPRRHPGRRLVWIVFFLAAVVWLGLALRPGPAPELALTSESPGVGRRPASVRVAVAEPSRGVAWLKLEALQGDRLQVLADLPLATRPAWAPWRPRTAEHATVLEVGRESLPGLEAGELTLRATAAGAPALFSGGRLATAQLALAVRFTPPALAVLSAQHNVAQGGSGAVAYRVAAEALEPGGRDGVQAGELFFPGRPLAGQDGVRVALFGVPYDLGDPSAIRLVASDGLGNETAVAFVDRFFARPPAHDRIELADRFLEKVVAEVYAETPELEASGDLLADYLTLNGELRRRNAATLAELARASRPEILWRGPFRQMPNSLVTSRFADRRTYLYQGREVDRQDHLGYDLATRAHDVVPASNRGVVALARYFGIYGNTVVVDHGFGLQSLYSHLSSIAVAEGAAVEAGQELGRTGQTGLAGGDHLHFTLLIGGLPVDPVEWWDEAWLRQRLQPKLAGSAPGP